MTSLTDTQVVTASGGLVELGFYKLTDSLTISASSWSTPDTIIPNTTVVCDGSPVVIDFSLPSVEVSGYGNIRMSLYRDNTLIAYNVCYISNTDMYSGERSSASFQYRDTPTAGSHTYSVRALAGGYGAYIYTSSGISEYADGPGWMRVSKIVQATQWPAVTTGTVICTSSTRPSSPFEGQQIYESDTKRMLVWNGSSWRTFAETDAAIGTPLQIVQTQHSSATQNAGVGSNYSNYAGLQTSFTTGGSSRVLVQGNLGSIQPSTANSMGIVKCDYNNSSLDPAVTTNMVAGTTAEWSHNGFDLKNMPFSGITPVLAAGTYTFRVKVRSPQAVTLQWNWHSYAEQRSWLTLTEVAS